MRSAFGTFSCLLLVWTLGCTTQNSQPAPAAGTAGQGGDSTGDNPQGVGGYDYSDRVAPSASPPGGLSPQQVPLFVSIGWDDNASPSGVEWTLAMVRGKRNPAGNSQARTYDNEPVTMTFYNTGTYANSAADAWKQAFYEGHEAGNHTVSHGTHLQESNEFDLWNTELADCTTTLINRSGIPRDSVVGFRAPFLAANATMFEAVLANGFWYDCSLEEGFQKDQDGTNYFWPYTLDTGSPGNAYMVSQDMGKLPIGTYPGLWEMPVYALIAPPDEEAAHYGFEPGLRERLATHMEIFNPADGKITGFDYNLWFEYQMTVEEVVATLKYTLDLRLQGNRAPFFFGAHSDQYSGANEYRRQAIEEFVEYALSKDEVRVVSTNKVLAWLRDPAPL